ncbi:MAG TPA: substrate-binding domain-containing protein [Thermomicrobiales bacterium]|nr:substrate-binding domain-containing protein [Thermomicrobiales bacterium]
MSQHQDNTNSAGLSRREILRRASVGSAGVAAGLSIASGSLAVPAALAAPRAQGTQRKVIFVNHDNNPFFVPVRAGLEQFAAMANWETQFTGPATGDTVATVELQRQAIAAQPDAVGFTRIDTTSFDDNIREAQDQGIFVILFNTQSEGYQDLGVAYVGQIPQPAAETGGYQCGKFAQEITGKTEGKVIMGIIQPGHSALEARHRGYEAGIARYNEENGTSYTTEALETSTDGAKSIAAQQAKYAAEGDQIVAFAHADYGHQFTAQFIRENGLQGKFANGGFDLLPDVLTAIQNGEAQWTVGQNPFAQGWVTSALIHMKLENGYDASDYIIGADLVTAENVDAVIEREAQFEG